MRAIAGLVLLFACAGLPGHGETPHAYPSPAQVARVERAVVLPRGASPLAKYARYYSLQTVDGRAVVVGYYLLGQGEPGVHFGASPVTVMDGGCGVVTVVFDLRDNAIRSAQCNGVA